MRSSPDSESGRPSIGHALLLCGLLGVGSSSIAGVGCTASVSSPSQPPSVGSTGNPAGGGAGANVGTVGGTGNTGATLPPTGGPGGGGVGPLAGTGAATAAACTTIEPGRVTVHRLNILEYNNTVRDLLGDATQPGAAFPDDTGGENFDNNADVLATSPLLFSKLETAADNLTTAALATGSAARAKLITCDATKTGDAPCAMTVMTSFARKAWRRPATSAELARLVAFVPLARAAGDGFDQGIAQAMKAALLSPNFMFRPELDPDPAATAPRLLNNYEIASRLSYFLWSSLPDDALATAADMGQLQDVATLQQQAGRMLDDAKADTLVSDMGGQWFGTYKMATVTPLATSFPKWDPALGTSMVQETNMFLKDVLTGASTSFLDVLDAPYTYANARLAQHYGLTGVTGTGFQKVSLAGTNRGGLIMQGAILTTTSFPTRTSPVKRGQWVMANILCTPPPPPPDAVPSLDQTVVPPGSSVRTQLDAHIANPSCAGCHTLMDPIGYALEHFDGIGAWRDVDGTSAIDATGQLPDGTKFDGAQGLASALRQTGQANIAACATKKIFSYSLGRDPVAADQCQLAHLSTSFAGANYNMRSLIMQMVASDTFRMRRPVAPGGI
jgi:hypothetical protein